MRPTRREFLALTAFEWLLPWRWFRGDPQIAGIRFREVRRGGERRYIWLHGDEQTAYAVLSARIENAPTGRAFFIRSDARHVGLMGGQIDPNRIWSRDGAERSLRSLNPGWTAEQVREALDEIDDDRESFLRRLLPEDGGLLIALHNNGPAYSVQDEVPISDRVAINDSAHADEFMLCTMQPDYEILAGGPYNVVLQSEPPPPDDGSLSRLCAARKVRYVNIEAAHGNREGQERMLGWVETLLP